MAFFQRNQFGFKQTSVPVTIPNNDVARLMYYFDVVCNTIDYNDADISRFRDYSNWRSLSFNDIRVLLVLCLTISPDQGCQIFKHKKRKTGQKKRKKAENDTLKNGKKSGK